LPLFHNEDFGIEAGIATATSCLEDTH